MKHILILTDFSTRAEYAAEFALNLAVKNQTSLLLCHVMEITSQLADGVAFNWPVADYLKLKNESLQDIKNLSVHLEGLIPLDSSFKPAIAYLTDFGLLAEVVETIIEEKSIDLVIMGSHKSNGIARLLFGSHTHILLDKINCPVLLVPENVEFTGVDTIAYATDLTFNNKSVIEYLTNIAKPFNAIVSVNHISPFDARGIAEEQARAYADHNKLTSDQSPVVFHNIKGDNVKSGLLDMISTGKVNILALVHKRYDFFGHLFHTSISKKMADLATIPLLILPYSFSLDETELTEDQLEHFCFETERPKSL